MSRRNAAAPLPEQRSDVEVNLMHADRFAAQGQTAQAIALYRTVGTTCKARGDHRLAVTAFASVARLEGPGSDARLHIGECLLAMEQRSDAARTLELAGQEFLSRGFVPSALHALRLAADAEPTAARWRTYVEYSTRHGRRDEAIRHLAELTSTSCEIDPRALIGLSRILLDVIPGHVPTLRRVARAHLMLRQVHQAVDAIRAILHVRPGDADALERMAEAFSALGRHEKAAEVMLRLARSIATGGPTCHDEVRRIVNRGMLWDPRNAELVALQQQYDDRPKAVAREIVVGAAPPAPLREAPLLDLSEFVEATPYEQSVVELSPIECEIYDEPSPAHGVGPMLPFPA